MPEARQLAIPDGYYQPFAVITDDDHAGWIIIATALGIALIILSSIVRTFIRVSFGQKFGLDDILLAIATALAIIQAGIVLGALDQGLGKDVELVGDDDLDDVERLYYTANIFAILVLGLTKVSVSHFILRLTPIKLQRQIVYGVMVASAVWTFVAVFMVSLQCELDHPWAVIDSKCPGIRARLLFIGILDGILELATFSSACFLMADLHTAFLNKTIVIGVFAFRLPIIAIIGLRVSAFDVPNFTSNFTLAESEYMVWTETQINYSIISATIPILRPFINTLSTHYGQGAAGEYSSSAFPSPNNTFMLTSLSFSSRRKSKAPVMPSYQDEEPELPLADRIDTVLSAREQGVSAGPSSTRGSSGRRESVESGSEDQIMTIRKDMEWEVRREGLQPP